MSKSKAHKKRNPIANEIWTNRIYRHKVITDKRRKAQEELSKPDSSEY